MEAMLARGVGRGVIITINYGRKDSLFIPQDEIQAVIDALGGAAIALAAIDALGEAAIQCGLWTEREGSDDR